MDSLNLPARRALIDLCQRWQIMDLAAFGSVARGSNRADSDLDLQVTFAPDAPCDAVDIVGLRAELADFFGRTVDLVEENAIRHPYRKASILRDKSVLHAA